MKDLSSLNLDYEIKKRIEKYLNILIDEEEKEFIEKCINEEDIGKLHQMFYKDLEFGTGGMRGLLGYGSSCMNLTNVARAALAVTKYFYNIHSNIKNNGKVSDLKIAICYDTRKNSQLFAKITSIIAAKNGFNVFMVKEPLPTPFLSFAIRKLSCVCGIMITASHNPKEYNGYKVYDNTGCQILYPADEEIVKYYNNIYEIEKCRIEEYERLLNSRNIQFIDDSLVDDFVESSINYDNNKKNYSFSNLKVAFTSVHGTGITPFKKIASRLNFEVFYPEKQILQDENFPTVKSPDPENKECLKEVIDKGIKNNADIIIATDPDADRVRFGFRNSDLSYFLPDGHEIAIILFYFLCLKMQKNFYEISEINLNSFLLPYYGATTIVTTDLIETIARYFGLDIHITLIGFKYIGETINNIKDNKFLFAAEESYGFLASSNVRDKDAFSSLIVALEVASYCKENSITVRSYLDNIFKQFGYYKHDTINLFFEGYEGLNKMKRIMKKMREEPLEIINEKKVRKIIDYLYDKTDLPKSNIIQFFGENFKITIRPSGTESKIKIYIQVIGRNEQESVIMLDSFKNSFIEQLKSSSPDLFDNN
ncbi:MAG TPA: phospho-sugar mutase [Exilispira sp.]|nr:phospho-sugar mutase [Exilispira sp.]